MNVRLTTPALLLLAALAHAQKTQLTLEQTAIAQRWTEMHTDRITATADGRGITLSDVRRQIEPVIGQIRASAGTEEQFSKALAQAADETIRSMADRQLVIAEFRSGAAKLPESYVDSDIEETVRRDFAGDRNRFVASLRAAGMTPLSYRKFIEERIIFEYMVGQVRRSVGEVSPGKVQAYYDKHRSEFARKEQIKVRQITLTQGAAETTAEAKARVSAWSKALRQPSELAATLEHFKVKGPKFTGATPTFAEIAERISTDDYARKGGDAGWRNLEELNDRVAVVLRDLKDEAISEPVQFDLEPGKSVWFILRREGFRPQGFASPSDPEVIAEIEDKVRKTEMNNAVQEWLAELRRKHHVDIR